MTASLECSSDGLLARYVATSIRESAKSLTVLQGLTGLHRSKLGRMRLGRHPVTFEEAHLVFRAVDKPVRALSVLSCLGEDCAITPEVLGYLEQFLSNLPLLIERLNELGNMLNPKWGTGSVHHLVGVLGELAARRSEADQFRSPHV